MKLSICIPTYNRPNSLLNCLNSLVKQNNKNFEICISDNCSKQNIRKIIKPYKKKLKIKYNRNKKNLGFALNLLKVSQMARGEFIWFLGDDDLLTYKATDYVSKLIQKNKICDFFWINSFYLNASFLKNFSKPFDTKFLPKNMNTHSVLKKNKKLNFFELINHKICFDFLLGMYCCVFRRELWNRNLDVINYKLIKDRRTWSNFENTSFFIKVYCKAFGKSKAFFCAKPLSVNLYGVREWGNLYNFVEIVRLPEALDYYRSKGLGFFQYIYSKNYSLRNFFNNFTKIIFYKGHTGLEYVSFKKHFFYNLIYPNTWLSILYFLFRKVSEILYKNKLKS